MKITLIFPPLGENGQKVKGMPLAPPVLEYLAGLTLDTFPQAELELIDANRTDFKIESIHADLVGISVLTPQAPWAYRTGAQFKKRGIPVVMGGVHISALPDEAALYCDALVLGEAESVWASLLGDFKKGNLQKRYLGKPLPLTDLSTPKAGMLKGSYMFGSFFTSRGCPYSCAFCSVPRFFGNELRLRPIADVVREVAASPRRMFWNIDDNIWGYDIDRSIELFRELAQNGRRKYWFGACNLTSLDHPRWPELLYWARESGLTSVMVGWESANSLTLEQLKADRKQGHSRAEAIRKLRSAGIDVMLFVLVGSLNDTRSDLEAIIRLSEDLDVAVRPVMLTPLPGTPLFEDYRPLLIPEYNWDKYDGIQAVFQHPNFTTTELERELASLWQEVFRLPKIFGRLGRISSKGFPVAHINSFIFQYVQSRAYQAYTTKLLRYRK